MQYNIRLNEMYGDNDMPWPEFCTLLSGITARTPLGIIVGIRIEDDNDTLKYFTAEQHRIRNAWRSRHSAFEHMTEDEKSAGAKALQGFFSGSMGRRADHGGKHREDQT